MTITVKQFCAGILCGGAFVFALHAEWFATVCAAATFILAELLIYITETK